MNIRLTMDLDGEVLERWDLTDWDLNKIVAANMLMSEIRIEWGKAQERIMKTTRELGQ